MVGLIKSGEETIQSVEENSPLPKKREFCQQITFALEMATSTPPLVSSLPANSADLGLARPIITQAHEPMS